MNAPRKEIDDLLQSDEQVQVSRLVGELKDDSPSMEWRSALNQRLLQVQRRKRREPWIWRLSFVGAAASLAFALWMGGIFADPSKTPAIKESQLVSEHLRAVDTNDLVGASLNQLEASRRSNGPAEPYQWQESDLDTL